MHMSREYDFHYSIVFIIVVEGLVSSLHNLKELISH